MPSESPEQKRLMSAVAHNRDFARKVGIPQSVGREFHNADRGKYGHKRSKRRSRRGRRG